MVGTLWAAAYTAKPTPEPGHWGTTEAGGSIKEKPRLRRVKLDSCPLIPLNAIQKLGLANCINHISRLNLNDCLCTAPAKSSRHFVYGLLVSELFTL